MISGFLNEEWELIIPLKASGPKGKTLTFEAAIDTGYNGDLTLPISMVLRLGLKRDRQEVVTLADGSEIDVDVYPATLFWDGRRRAISVDEADTEPLVGTRLLKGFELTAQYTRKGRVTIKAIR